MESAPAGKVNMPGCDFLWLIHKKVRLVISMDYPHPNGYINLRHENIKITTASLGDGFKAGAVLSNMKEME